MRLQKQLSFIIFFLLINSPSSTVCSQEKTFYFRGQSSPENILGIPNSIIKKVRFLQELSLLTSYTTNEPKPKKKDWGRIIRQYNSVNNEDNPAIISDEIFNDIKIISYAHEQRANNEKNYIYLLSCNRITAAKDLYYAAWNFREKKLCKMAIKSLPPELSSQILIKHHLKQTPDQTIVFPDAARVAVAAISPDGSHCAVAEIKSNILSLYAAQDMTKPLNSIQTGSTEFQTSGYVQFLDNDLTLLSCAKSSSYSGNTPFKLWFKNKTQVITVAGGGDNGHTFALHPNNDNNLIAFIGSQNYVIHFLDSNKHYTYQSIQLSRLAISMVTSPGVKWNKIGDRILFHAHIDGTSDRGCDPQTDHRDDIFIIDYSTITPQSIDRVDLNSNKEYIYDAQWIDEQYIIGLSTDHIFIWNLQGEQVRSIDSQLFECLKPLQHSVTFDKEFSSRTKTIMRSFYPGKISVNTDNKTCFIDQAMDGHIIMMNLDTWTPYLFSLENIMVKKKKYDGDKGYDKTIKTIFSPTGEHLAFLYNNILMLYESQSGRVKGTSKIEQTKNIKSIEFSSTGNKLTVSHNQGFDIYILTKDNSEKNIKGDIVTINDQPSQNPFLFWAMLSTVTIIGGLILWKYLKR